MKKLVSLFALLVYTTYVTHAQAIIHQYNIVWSGSGVTATANITFNSDFVYYNPSSIENGDDYNGSVTGLINNLVISVAGDPNPVNNGTFTIQDYSDLQWNTGGVNLDLNSKNILPQFGSGADLSIIAKNTSLAPTADWSDPLLTLRTGNGNGTLLTMQSFSAVPEPEEWMAITSLGLIGFGVFYKKMYRKYEI